MAAESRNPYAKRRPRGTVPENDQAKTRAIRLTDAQWENFRQMGGADWLRAQLEAYAKSRET